MEEALLRLVGEKEPKKVSASERIGRLELKVAVLEERLSRLDFYEKLVYILLAVAFSEIVLRVLGVLK